MTKLTPPQVSGTLARKRLFRRLDRLREYPGIWVAGPPGAGKTTLLSTYLGARRREKSLLYQVDEGDADPATFFYYLGLAVRRATPRRRRPMPLLTPEHVPALTTFTRNFFRRLFERIPEPGLLVLDNFQNLPETSPVHAVLRTAMEEVPTGFALVFLSRELPPGSMRSLQGDGRLGVLGWEELRLADEEAAAIVQSRGFAPETAQAWMQTAAGWAAGLVLLMEWARIEGGEATADTAPGLEYVFDFFAGQIFDGLPGTEQRLLLKSAFLPVMSAATLEALTGQGGAGRFLSGLTRSNYFTTRHPGSRTTYQYHPLFRAFLLERARRVLGEAACRELESRAAAVLEAEGEYTVAAEYFVRLADWAGLERLLDVAGPRLIRQGRHRTVLGWLEAVPAAEAERRPWLRYWHGEALVFVDPARATSVLEAAWRQFKMGEDARGCYFTWAAVGEQYLARREFEDVAIWLQRLRYLRRHHPEFDSPATEARVVPAAYYMMIILAPDDPDIAEWEARALGLLQSEMPAERRLAAAFFLLLRHTWFGGSREASTRVVETARALLEATEVSPMAEIMWQTAEAQFHFWYGGGKADDSMRACADRAWTLANKHDLRGLDSLIDSDKVMSRLAEDDHRAARAELERLSRRAVAWPSYDEARIRFERAWCEWTAGDLVAAREQADISVQLARECNVPGPSVFSTFGSAQIDTSRGEYRSAQREFARARQLARRYGFTNALAMCRLAVARLAFERGRRARGRALLRGALAIGAGKRLMRMPFVRKRDLAALCAEALECGIETDYARELVRERDLRPDPPPVAVARWPWRIEVRCLGHWSVTHEGEPLRFGRKMPRRTLDLLKAILALGGHEVPETKLLDALWEGEDADRARSALSTALHRLRRLLGSDVVLQGDGRLGLDPAAVWVDAWAFEYHVDAADAARRAGRADDMAERLRHALALYRGHFLDGLTDAAWAVAARERLRSRFVRETGRLGEHLEAAGAWQEAVELYQHALDLDDLVEAHYQGLLRCYDRLGLRAEAVDAWQRCRRALGRGLGVAPSPVTEQLYRAATGVRGAD